MNLVRRRSDLGAWAPALLVLVVAVPVAMVVLLHGWSGLYGQDAYAYQGYAIGELRAAILEMRAPAPFTWPPGFPLAVAVTSLVTGPGTLAGQLVSLVTGAAVPVFVFLLARELVVPLGWPRRTTPLLAGTIAAVTPHLWQSAAVVMSDTTGLAPMTLGAWALARWANGGRTRWSVLAAASCAFAADTRWAYGIATLPLAIAGVVIARRRAAGCGWRGVAHEAGPATAAGLAVLAPMVGPMLWSASRSEPVPFAIELGSHAWSVDHLLGSTGTTADGAMHYAWPMLPWMAAQPFQPYHLGPVLGLAALAGTVLVLRRPSVVVVAMLVGWPLAVLGFLSGDVIQNTRFALAVLPPLAILAAGGVCSAIAWLERRRGERGAPWLVHGAWVMVAIVLVTQAAASWRFTDTFVDRLQADQVAVEGLVVQVPPGDRLVGFQATLQLRQEGRDVIELADLDTAAASVLLADGGPTWVLAPADAFGPQWAGAREGAVLAVLSASASWHEVARDGTWRLWRVGAEPVARQGAYPLMMCRPC